MMVGGGGGTYYYVHDHLYSPVALVDGVNGDVAERYEYDAYGKVTIRNPQYAIRAFMAIATCLQAEGLIY